MGINKTIQPDKVDEITELRHQVAEREAQVERLRRAVEANHKWHLNHDDYDGYGESELCEMNHKAVNKSPSTALAELLKPVEEKLAKLQCIMTGRGYAGEAYLKEAFALLKQLQASTEGGKQSA
jgi:hypothetical protein